ncbi:BPTI/Kunitz domain-containing protein 5-like [Ixodes scapularis]|uniref:BPTI/Kunitz domain-containing protein 5-like n=1 Tax=Ixodes scapularis TaxID=6945 RepID=UPI001A9E06E3|nr:BPTI/Kunitz domain-containing protein 5-like [Ixodes scapularis]
MSSIKLIFLLSHICIVYGVGDCASRISQQSIPQERNEENITENSDVNSKVWTTKCYTTKTSCPRRSKNWHFNGLVGRCETSTPSFCGGTKNAFSNFKECQNNCEKEEIVTHQDCRTNLDWGKCEDKKKGRPKKGVYRWYFNSTDSNCHKFLWYRCTGNRNNFPTKQDCKVCQTAMKTTPATETPPPAC